MSALLQVQNLKIEFKVNGRWLEATREVTFDVPAGKIVSLVGESGCGKSITAMSILGLLPKDYSKIAQGSILFEGKNLLTLNEKELNLIRGEKIGMIFQEPMSALNPVIKVGKQISEVALIHHGANSAIKERVLKLMNEAGIVNPKQRFDQYPHELSGGMRQRIMIAMALMNDPELLIADEPTTALDVSIQAQILDKISQLQKDRNMGVLLITHDLSIVREISDELVMMYAGEIVEQGRVEDVFENALHPYTKALQKTRPSLGETDKLYPIPGRVPPLTLVPMHCRFADRCSDVLDECKKSKIEFNQKYPSHGVRCIRA